MEQRDAAEINAAFEQLIAEGFVFKRVLALLLAEAPLAMAHVRAADSQWLRDFLEGKPFTDSFIARAVETCDTIRLGTENLLAERGAQP